MEASGQINRYLDKCVFVINQRLDRRWGEEIWRIDGIVKSAIGAGRALMLMVMAREGLKTMMGVFVRKYIDGFLCQCRIEFLT